MSTVLPCFPRRLHRYGTDWAALLDGRVHKLTRGDDFTCAISTIRSNVHNVAKRMGLRVRTHSASNDEIVVQAFKAARAEAAE